MPKTKLIEDQRAFSSTADALFFLVLISIATVILMPSIMAERQYDAAAYTATQDFDKHLLSSLLNSNVDDFEYEITPLAITGITIPENALINDPINTMFGRQQHHRTFADMIAEDMVLTLAMNGNGTTRYINPIAQEHKEKTSDAIASYLDTRIGGRYDYHLQANWEPVEDYPLKNSISVGITPPYDAIRQSSRITLPLNTRTSRDELFVNINDSMLEELHNSSNTTKFSAYHEAFNNTIEEASTSTAELITDIVFPSDYLRSLIRQDITQSTETVFISNPHDDKEDPEMLIAEYILNYSMKTIYGSSSMPAELNNSIISIIEKEIIERNQQNIATHLHNDIDQKINETVSQMVNSTNISTTKELRDVQVDEIYRKVNNGYVDITLSIW
ncbi:hypothetical protein SAMN04488587_1152 [Methanococcoides vulcani]|uniref:Uncharacterized protein n=1 Tax=Methanococcoides vulcani TaxID=1353158 RepID=A0A1H9ZI73_9EURY|nr:hypothetical protein [Methanococcoides vulcani]SES81296.1 hypothetical protein SAMN04488587_1152 [Methanococcoides vulcani]